jgi:uncharacterized protein (UPF0548 family)
MAAGKSLWRAVFAEFILKFLPALACVFVVWYWGRHWLSHLDIRISSETWAVLMTVLLVVIQVVFLRRFVRLLTAAKSKAK